MDRDHLHRQYFSWLAPEFPEIYANPQNALVVPYGTTRVVIDSQSLDDGRHAVSIRAAVLMDLEPVQELVAHVAVRANDFLFGNLYFFPVDDGAYDLDVTVKVLDTWLTAAGLVEMVVVVAESATTKAAELAPRFGGRLPNPSGRVEKRMFVGDESQGRGDVWEALENALETQRCLVLGTVLTVTTASGAAAAAILDAHRDPRDVNAAV